MKGAYFIFFSVFNCDIWPRNSGGVTFAWKPETYLSAYLPSYHYQYQDKKGIHSLDLHTIKKRTRREKLWYLTNPTPIHNDYINH